MSKKKSKPKTVTLQVVNPDGTKGKPFTFSEDGTAIITAPFEAQTNCFWVRGEMQVVIELA